MNRQELIDYVSITYAENAERPFANDQSIVVFRHSSGRKWFCVVMTIEKKKLEIMQNGYIDIINVKCAQEIIDSFWQESGIFPAYHMSKAHWLSVALDGSATDDTIKWLLDLSHTLTAPKIKKKNAPQ